MSITADDILGHDESGAGEKIDFPPSPFPVMTWKTDEKTTKTLHMGRRLKGVLVKRIENVQKKKNEKTGVREVVFQPEKFHDGTPNPRYLDKKTGKPSPKTFDMIFVLAKEIEGVALPDGCFRTTDGLIVYRDYLQGHKRWEFGQAKKEALGEANQYGWPTGLGVNIEFADTEKVGDGTKWLWSIECSPVPAKGTKAHDAIKTGVFEAYLALKAYDDEIKALIAANSDGTGDLDEMVRNAHSGGTGADEADDSENPF